LIKLICFDTEFDQISKFDASLNSWRFDPYLNQSEESFKVSKLKYPFKPTINLKKIKIFRFGEF